MSGASASNCNAVWEIIEAVGANACPQVDEHAQIQQSVCEQEVADLAADPQRLTKALGILFPGGVPLTDEFYSRLAELDFRLGLNAQSHRLAGILWTTAVEQLGMAKAEELIRRFTPPANYFFSGLDWLPVFLERVDLRAQFAADWFPSLIRHIGDDLAVVELWSTIGTFCDNHLASAMQVLICLIEKPDQDEPEVGVAALLLGILRAVQRPAHLEPAFAKFHVSLINDRRSNARAIYHRSWIESAQRGKITVSELKDLTTRMGADSSNKHQQVWIVTGVLSSQKLSPDCFNCGMEWLRANISPQLSAEEKYHVVKFVARRSRGNFQDANDLVIALLPIDPEQKGIWGRIATMLVHLVRSDSDAFTELFIRISSRAAEPMLKLIQDRHSGFEQMLAELALRNGGDLVGRLLVSTRSESRQLALTLFSKLHLTSLPSRTLEGIDDTRLALLLSELQLSSLEGPAIAKFLVMLIPCVERVGNRLQSEFADELKFQLKNFPGGCKETLQPNAHQYPILDSAIAEVDRYFDALHTANESGIRRIEVPGFRQAARLAARRFAHHVSEGTKKFSGLMQCVETVQLLYGKAWRTFHGGTLSSSADLKVISHSMEMPRLEFIDPEAARLRRLHASRRIASLTVALASTTEP